MAPRQRFQSEIYFREEEQTIVFAQTPTPRAWEALYSASAWDVVDEPPPTTTRSVVPRSISLPTPTSTRTSVVPRSISLPTPASTSRVEPTKERGMVVVLGPSPTATTATNRVDEEEKDDELWFRSHSTFASTTARATATAWEHCWEEVGTCSSPTCFSCATPHRGPRFLRVCPSTRLCRPLAGTRWWNHPNACRIGLVDPGSVAKSLSSSPAMDPFQAWLQQRLQPLWDLLTPSHNKSYNQQDQWSQEWDRWFQDDASWEFSTRGAKGVCNKP